MNSLQTTAHLIFNHFVGRADCKLAYKPDGSCYNDKAGVTEEDIYQHLKNQSPSGQTIGIFLDESTSDDANVKAAVLDLDYHIEHIKKTVKNVEKLTVVSEIANSMHPMPQIVACSGGKGWHLYWLADEKTKRHQAINFLKEKKAWVMGNYPEGLSAVDCRPDGTGDYGLGVKLFLPFYKKELKGRLPWKVSTLFYLNGDGYTPMDVRSESNVRDFNAWLQNPERHFLNGRAQVKPQTMVKVEDAEYEEEPPYIDVLKTTLDWAVPIYYHKDIERLRGQEGRARHLMIMDTLEKNCGVQWKKYVHHFTKRVFGKEYDYEKTAREIRYVSKGYGVDDLPIPHRDLRPRELEWLIYIVDKMGDKPFKKNDIAKAWVKEGRGALSAARAAIDRLKKKKRIEQIDVHTFKLMDEVYSKVEVEVVDMTTLADNCRFEDELTYISYKDIEAIDEGDFFNTDPKDFFKSLKRKLQMRKGIDPYEITIVLDGKLPAPPIKLGDIRKEQLDTVVTINARVTDVEHRRVEPHALEVSCPNCDHESIREIPTGFFMEGVAYDKLECIREGCANGKKKHKLKIIKTHRKKFNILTVSDQDTGEKMKVIVYDYKATAYERHLPIIISGVYSTYKPPNKGRSVDSDKDYISAICWEHADPNDIFHMNVDDDKVLDFKMMYGDDPLGNLAILTAIGQQYYIPPLHRLLVLMSCYAPAQASMQDNRHNVNLTLVGRHGSGKNGALKFYQYVYPSRFIEGKSSTMAGIGLRLPKSDGGTAIPGELPRANHKFAIWDEFDVSIKNDPSSLGQLKGIFENRCVRRNEVLMPADMPIVCMMNYPDKYEDGEISRMLIDGEVKGSRLMSILTDYRGDEKRAAMDTSMLKALYSRMLIISMEGPGMPHLSANENPLAIDMSHGTNSEEYKEGAKKVQRQSAMALHYIAYCIQNFHPIIDDMNYIKERKDELFLKYFQIARSTERVRYEHDFDTLLYSLARLNEHKVVTTEDVDYMLEFFEFILKHFRDGMA